MKNVKKLLAVLLAMVMVLSLLAGCGSKSSKKKSSKKDDDDDDDDKETTSATGDSTGSTDGTGSTGDYEIVLPGDGETEPTEDNNNVPTEGNNTQTPPSNKVEQTETNLELGSVKNNKYTNTFLGVSLELGSEWTFLSDEEIRENNKTAMGLLDDDYQEAIKKVSNFTDMMATNPTNGSTINVSFIKNNGLTEDTLAAASKETTKTALQQNGFANVNVVVGKSAFLGKNHASLTITGTYMGLAVHEKVIYILCEDYIALVTVCSFQTNDCNTLLSKFKTI